MSEYENLRLDNQLCFALYAATNAITRVYRGKLKEVGITYPQYLVLLVLWEGDAIPIKAIADRLQLDAATITPLVQRLEEASLVTKKRDATDDRVVNVYLSEKAREIQSRVAELQNSVACQTGLSDQKFEELRSSLHKLVETLNQGTEPPKEVAA